MAVQLVGISYHDLPDSAMTTRALRVLLEDVLKLAESSIPAWSTVKHLTQASERGDYTFDIIVSKGIDKPFKIEAFLSEDYKECPPTWNVGDIVRFSWVHTRHVDFEFCNFLMELKQGIIKFKDFYKSTHTQGFRDVVSGDIVH